MERTQPFLGTEPPPAVKAGTRWLSVRRVVIEPFSEACWPGSTQVGAGRALFYQRRRRTGRTSWKAARIFQSDSQSIVITPCFRPIFA